MKTKVLQFILVGLSAALLGYYVGVSKVSISWKTYSPKISITSKEPPGAVTSIDLSLFWTVLEKLENSYYDKNALSAQKLVNGAISGMVGSLDDPYTIYLPSKQNEDFKQGLAGQFEGIGAELGTEDKQIMVIAPLDGMPAQKAGIRAGDYIIKVDDKSTEGWTLAQTVDKIRGPKGTVVALTIVHKDEAKPVEIKVTRGTITVKSVDGKIKKVSDIENISIKDDKKDEKKDESNASLGVPVLGKKDKQVIYIRLSQFGDKTNDEWVAMVNDVTIQMKKSNGAVKGLILDLRNNPGGYLTDAAFIASEFLKEGVIVTQEKGNGERTNFTVSRKGLLTDIPMIVLINKGSASASEIVSGSLRDYNRAKLIGETSFGKGTIQQAEDLGDGAGLHVTIAKWLTPKGIWVHGKGLTPDIEVKLDEKNPSHDTQLEKAVEELIK